MSTASPKEQLLESVNVFLYAGETELLEVDAKSKTIDIDIENKQFLKGLIKMGRDFTKQQQNNKKNKPEKEAKKSPGALTIAKTVAENLKKMGITVTLSYRGGVVVTLGANARPKLLQLITKTRAIALNSFFKAIRMFI